MEDEGKRELRRLQTKYKKWSGITQSQSSACRGLDSSCTSALQDTLPPRAFRAAQALVLSGSIALLGVVATLVIFYVMASPTFGWTGVPPLQDCLGLYRSASGVRICVSTFSVSSSYCAPYTHSIILMRVRMRSVCPRHVLMSYACRVVQGAA